MEHPLSWQIAEIEAITRETPRVKTFTLRLPAWTPHRAGQHYDVRLTAPDGYSAQRSYSVASEPERTGVVDLTVERLEDGEVSTHMHDVAVVGDRLEARGPIGGYFVWTPDLREPLLLVAGGSGVVPLTAIIRQRAAAGSRVPARLLYSSRSPEHVIYADEFERRNASGDGLEVIHTFTRAPPPGWSGYARRIDGAMLEETLEPLGRSARAYVCGPTLLVEAVAGMLVEFGVPADCVRTERFGPTGEVSPRAV